MESSGFGGWYLVELMGHRRLAGKVSEETVAGASMLRIDVHRRQFYSASAIYALTPVTEETALGLAEQVRSRPVQEYDFPSEYRERLKRDALPASDVDTEADADGFHRSSVEW